MCDPVCAKIQQWEQNLEKLNLDLFRLRCYLSSLQGSELPNPKSLLAVASRPSKSMLGRLGVFSVSSFHALVSRGSTLPFFLKKKGRRKLNQTVNLPLWTLTGVQPRRGHTEAALPVSFGRKPEEGSAVLPEGPG